MRLLQDKWLSRFPQKGFLVTPISVRDIVDLYQFRKLLECFAVEQVAQSASAEQLARTPRHAGPGEGPRRPTRRPWCMANEAFHLRLAALAGNERVLHQLSLTLAFARRLDTLYMRVDRTWIAHEDLLAALEAARRRRSPDGHDRPPGPLPGLPRQAVRPVRPPDPLTGALMFKHAIVRKPGENFSEGLTSVGQGTLGLPDYREGPGAARRLLPRPWRPAA